MLQSEFLKKTFRNSVAIAETLPEVPFVRTRPAKEHGLLSDFQRELVELASFLNGDYMWIGMKTIRKLSDFSAENGNKIKIRKWKQNFAKRKWKRKLLCGNGNGNGTADSGGMTTETELSVSGNTELSVFAMRCFLHPIVPVISV